MHRQNLTGNLCYAQVVIRNLVHDALSSPDSQHGLRLSWKRCLASFAHSSRARVQIG